MLTLGLSSFTHDAAAALLEDGVIKAAIEDSKLSRSNTQGLPEMAMRYCLNKRGIGWHDLDVVAVDSRPFKRWIRQSLLLLRNVSSPLASTYYEANQLGTLARQLSDLRQLRHENGATSFKLLCLEHHLCHASAAFFQSPFDRALVLTLDEGADGKSVMVAIGEGSQLRVVQGISFPNSLAWVYSQVTELVGFIPHKEEHKTQWLSMEGEPSFKDIFLEMMCEPGSPLPHVNRRFVDCDATGRLKLSRHFYRRAGLLEHNSELSDDVRHALASSLQQACFETVRNLVEYFRRKHGIQNVCFGGGLFQNVVLVAALEKELGIDQVFVPPAPGNAGCAVGAGLLVWHSLMKKARGQEISHVYWGPAYSRHEIVDVLSNSKARYSYENTEERRLDAAIQLLQGGKVIGWFQGAAEFGPRALGNRSLLASPWAPYVKENLNDYIKHRERFRPFAIAIPEEDCARFFECSRLCRFMNSLGTVRSGSDVLPEGFALPGNQVRLHVVEEKANPLFWRLLKRFGSVAPAPMLINTSFNLGGEPLVGKPQDAFRSYFCSGIDALVIEGLLLSKHPVPVLRKPQVAHASSLAQLSQSAGLRR
jgi:carbamoyltransferase